VIPSANIRTAHAHDEKRYRDDNPKEDGGYDVDNYGESGHDRYDQQIEQHQTTVARSADAANEVNRPGIDVLNCDDLYSGRKYDTRYVAYDREQDVAHQKQNRHVDQDRKRCLCAKSAVGKAWSDVDAARDSADTGREHISDTEPHQKPVAVGFFRTSRRDELGAKKRVDCSDERQRQSATDDDRQKLDKVFEVDLIGDGPVGRRTFHCNRQADHRTELRAEPRQHECEIKHGADAETDQQRGDFRTNRTPLPHHGECNKGHRQTERLHLRQMSKDLLEGDVVVEAAHISQLHEK
jgi:hypothetical protein